MESKEVYIINDSSELKKSIENSGIQEIIIYENKSNDGLPVLKLVRNGVVVARISGGGDITVEDIKEALNDNFNTQYQVD